MKIEIGWNDERRTELANLTFIKLWQFIVQDDFPIDSIFRDGSKTDTTTTWTVAIESEGDSYDKGRRNWWDAW